MRPDPGPDCFAGKEAITHRGREQHAGQPARPGHPRGYEAQKGNDQIHLHVVSCLPMEWRWRRQAREYIPAALPAVTVKPSTVTEQADYEARKEE